MERKRGINGWNLDDYKTEKVITKCPHARFMESSIHGNGPFTGSSPKILALKGDAGKLRAGEPVHTRNSILHTLEASRKCMRMKSSSRLFCSTGAGRERSGAEA